MVLVREALSFWSQQRCAARRMLGGRTGTDFLLGRGLEGVD